jgi:hypothetical protein
MSVYPEFIQHIHDLGIYVPGHNYEEMYNIMVYNLTYNIISTNNFIYTYAQMNQLYEYLEELLAISESDIEPESETNNMHQNTNQDATQLFSNYIITTLNNQYNQTNTNNEFTYTNLVYYNNTHNYTTNTNNTNT